MMKRLLSFICVVLILVNIYGCAALVVGGVAGGVGTGVWLSGKMIQRVNASFERTAQAAKDALRSRGLSVVSKETTDKGIMQIRSRDNNGEKVWVDVYRISGTSSQIQVRVGMFYGNKESADSIMRSIAERL